MGYMSDDELRARLATLFLEAFEIGSGKQEWDVVDEVFCAFGLNWSELDARFPQALPQRAKLLREYAATQLARAAATAPELLNEVVRCGGRFVAMLEAIYARLARHSASTRGTAESFRLERTGVDESQLTISAAFIEQVHHIMERAHPTPVGVMDESALAIFTRWDNGVSYGQWPISGSEPGIRLVHALLDLSWLGEALGQKASLDPAWEAVACLWSQAHRAGESLVTAAEELIRSHVAHLDLLAGSDTEHLAKEVFEEDRDHWRDRPRAAEIERFRAGRWFCTTAVAHYVHGVNATSAVGLGDDHEPVLIPTADYLYGSGVSDLAAFVAMWRLGLWAEQERSETEARVMSNPAVASQWLDGIISACEDAGTWLTNDVLTTTGTVDVRSQIDAVEEFLNLPLWRQRSLLYEVWVLCATLEACEDARWDVELSGLSFVDRQWVLSAGPTLNPTATLRWGADETVLLDVWREPLRQTGAGILTPDITVSTPSPYPRDLLVVEAKDRLKMGAGQVALTGSPPDQSTSNQRTALGVAQRYASGLHPVATWICNHCDYRQGVEPETNHGDTWTRIHLADQFRPGHVPPAFKESVASALHPRHSSGTQPADTPVPALGLVVVADVTGSMHSRLEAAWATLLRVGGEPFASWRAVLFSDHGDDEPFLVRKLGPFPDAMALVGSLRTQPRGSGGDPEEALEDAMQRCRELVDDVGPQMILVLTDAAPHARADCPYHVDFSEEVRALLERGCQLQIASDWLGPKDQTWTEFMGTASVSMAPLEALVASWGDSWNPMPKLMK